MIPVLSVDSPVSTLTRLNIESGESRQFLLIELFDKFVSRAAPSTIFYGALFTIVTIILLFLLRTGRISKSEYWQFGVGLIAVSITYRVLHLMARSYGVGGLTERHSALIFIPALIGIAISFKTTDQGAPGYSIISKSIVFLTLPGILYQIINSSERYVLGESTPWSQIAGEIGSIPEGSVKRYAIGPIFSNLYWGGDRMSQSQC